MGQPDRSSHLDTVSPAEIATALRYMSRRRVYDWIREGQLETTKTGRKHHITETQLSKKLGPELAAEIVRGDRREREYSPPSHPKLRYQGDDRNELLTATECAEKAAERLQISESTYYENLHPYIKPEMIGDEVVRRIRKGELMDLLTMIPYVGAKQAFESWGKGR